MKLARLFIPLLIVIASASAFAQSPVIVAQVALFNQGAKIAPTALVTPALNGIYRVSAYMTQLATKQTKGRDVLTLTWSDDSGKEAEAPSTWVNLPNTVGGGFYAQNTIIVRVAAGQPITYSVQVGANTNFSYNLFITVEQLETD